jgi:hypothetical protein
VEFDVISLELFDLPPLTEYKLYIRNFGNNNAVQVYVQTGEDDASVDTQTDEIEMDNKSVQFPEITSQITNSDVLNINDTLKLVNFITKTSQVCEALLEENTIDTSQKKATFTSPFPFSIQYINLTFPKFLEFRTITSIFISFINCSLFYRYLFFQSITTFINYCIWRCY